MVAEMAKTILFRSSSLGYGDACRIGLHGRARALYEISRLENVLPLAGQA